MSPLPDRLLERALQRALQRALAAATRDSPRARALLSGLAGRRMRLVIRGTPWALTLEAGASELTLCELPAGESADATISGAPLSLLALSGPEPDQVIRRGDVSIEGDAETAQQFRELAMLLKPDLEHSLSGVLGRSGAHLIMQGARSVAAFTRATAWTQVQNLSEYLAHERDELVSRAEAEHFLRGVDELREQLDRVEARAAILAQKTGQTSGPEPA